MPSQIETTAITQHQTNPFRLPLKPAWLSRAVEKLLSLDTLAKHYETRPNADAEIPGKHVDDFLDHVLSALKVKFSVKHSDSLANIPASGPVIIVSNHPLGGLEGVAMTRLLRKVRPDLKVLTNELLTRIPEFSEVFIGVDVLSKDAVKRNLRGMREVMAHLSSDGAILIYPAGMVSSINTSNWHIEDRAWSNIVGKLQQRSRATCVPCYVQGRNSRLFYLSGLIHPRLRTALLPRELVNKSGSNTVLSVGSPITWKDIKELKSPDSITAYLRTATDLLSPNNESIDENQRALPPLETIDRNSAEQLRLQQDLDNIDEFRLLDYQEFDVYCAPYSKLGSLMDEIAIARERTFRAAGEGTGLDTDSDRYDPHYLHLFIWDRKNAAIVGGYRVGLADEIVSRLGVEGLYSRSLYKFNADYIKRIGGALEVGRSFVTLEYQRHPRALDLLWQGIGRWVVKNPSYHTLFGCVSISSEHSYRARAFLKDSLMESFRAEQNLLNGVRPIAPLKVRNKLWSDEVLKSLNSITMINKLLGQCNPGKSIPVLLRQYIALNGKFIGFSINQGFNNSLDGLIMVDLRKTPPKYLQRYLGKEASVKFLEQWSTESDVA